MRLEPGSSQTVCPYSGHIAADKEFIHFDDVEAVKKQVAWDVEADIVDSLSNMTSDFNRRQRPGGLISVKMEIKASREPKPLAIRTDLLRDLECDVCQRPYAVYAIALFCPDCGAPNVALHFQREVEIVGHEIEIADRLEQEGRREIAYRLMGNAHEDVLTAFEATLKTVYRHLARQLPSEQAEKLLSGKETRNAFQNVERARERFAALGLDPFSMLGVTELELLKMNSEKRHVIGHNLGMADEKSVALIQPEQPGETVHLVGDEIRQFADVCLRVIVVLDNHLTGR
jgi:hypothetical protein